MGSRVRVRVKSGVLEGSVCANDSNPGKDYYSFQGIPYARPPIGELRFKAPLPVEPWEGVRDATQDGEQCFSRHILYRQQKLGSEDCLTLNVYAPKDEIEWMNGNPDTSNLKPVMVFIHGGAFVTGSNSKMIYGPEFLLREDVILVVINYRIGFLGFLSLEDPSLGVPGNAGLKDMVLALKWVKRNIKYFNGDPKNVTIFGESAGAACVHLLMLSPSASGLFHKAIAQSGCAFNLWARSRKPDPLLSKVLGIDERDGKKILQKLQSMTVEELHALQDKFPDRWDISDKRVFGYTIENPDQNDQPFLTEDPVQIMEREEYNQVPLLLGFNSREGMLIHVFLKTPIKEILPEIEQHVPFDMNLIRDSDMSKSVAEQIMEFYFNDKKPNFDDDDLNYKFLTDNFFLRDIYKFAVMYSQSSFEQCFLYEMTLVTAINLFKVFSGIKSPGVCHADDISYLFKTAMHIDIKPGSPEDKGIRRFCRLWANFAKYGNPNAPNYDSLIPVYWKPFSEEDRNYLEIGEELIAKKNPAHERMMFWEKLYCQHVKHKL